MSKENLISKVRTLVKDEITKEDLLDLYNEWSTTYDQDVETISYHACVELAKVVKEYSPGNPACVNILDVGSGTGMNGVELSKLGFKNIDGLDPSSPSLDKAKQKGVYRDLFCEFFTKDPLDIPADSYDVIVTSATFVKGHLPYDCVHEMIRLVRPGGRICIAARTSSFQREDEYGQHLLPLTEELEREGKWKVLKWEKFQKFHAESMGYLIVFEIC